MDDDFGGGLVLLCVVLTVGVFIAAGWILYKIVEAIALWVRAEWDKYQAEKWEQERAKRMLETHQQALEAIDGEVTYWVDFQQFVAGKVEEAEAELEA